MALKDSKRPQADHPAMNDDFALFLLAPVNEGKTKPALKAQSEISARRLAPGKKKPKTVT